MDNILSQLRLKKGPRYDKNDKIVQYSILGKEQLFKDTRKLVKKTKRYKTYAFGKKDNNKKKKRGYLRKNSRFYIENQIKDGISKFGWVDPSCTKVNKFQKHNLSRYDVIKYMTLAKQKIIESR